MNTNELFDKVKELISGGDLDKAKAFLEENKDNLGEYFEQAKSLLDGANGVDGILDKVKGLFGK
ncbi:hypothetical protein ACVR05_06195 [Streptococcus caprae]|uniref:Isoleucyl-tRNA synthetase n=1 Tax=Streptococcus caprae TaxID=1640501 RepID=A0ABV8CVQ9_9STRE